MAHSSKDYMREYMQGYRKRDSLKKQVGVEVADLVDQYVLDMMERGTSLDNALMGFLDSVTPPEQVQPVAMASDSTESQEAPEVKKDCFGTRKAVSCHGDCNPDCLKAYLDESFKPQAQKDAERDVRTFALLKQTKDVLRKTELEDLIKIGAVIQAAREKREMQVDALTKKYMAQDPSLPEKTARETATWEMKQIENAESMKRMKVQDAWDLMSEEQRTAAKFKLLNASKKLRGET